VQLCYLRYPGVMLTVDEEPLVIGCDSSRVCAPCFFGGRRAYVFDAAICLPKPPKKQKIKSKQLLDFVFVRDYSGIELDEIMRQRK
jgi:hypothetical protein